MSKQELVLSSNCLKAASEKYRDLIQLLRDFGWPNQLDFNTKATTYLSSISPLLNIEWSTAITILSTVYQKTPVSFIFSRPLLFCLSGRSSQTFEFRDGFSSISGEPPGHLATNDFTRGMLLVPFNLKHDANIDLVLAGANRTNLS